MQEWPTGTNTSTALSKVYVSARFGGKREEWITRTLLDAYMLAFQTYCPMLATPEALANRLFLDRLEMKGSFSNGCEL